MLPLQTTPERIALNRITFGARDFDIANVKRMGWSAWVREQLDAPRGDDPALAAYLAAQRMHIEYPAYENKPYYSWPAVNEDRPLNYLTMSSAQIWAKTLQISPAADYREMARAYNELCSGVVIRATHSRYQLREFMADFWLNHFSISSAKDEQTKNALIVFDRDVIRPNVFGNFRLMLEVVTTSASMLKYLDNADSEANQPNENYARELMELHTLGRGAYLGKVSNADTAAKGFTDEDIIQASRAFSGWTLQQGTHFINGKNENTGVFAYNPNQHNYNAGFCLGFDLSFFKYAEVAQGLKVLDLVATHPATAQFVCTKLCRRIFGDAPPPAVIARAVAAFSAKADQPDQMKHVLNAILLDGPEISQGPAVKVRRPLERIVALARATDAKILANEYWATALRNVSDVPFSWPTPDGRPDTNEFWLNTATNLETWNQMQYLGAGLYGTTVYFTHDILAQTPPEAIKSPSLFVEYWVGSIIGYALSSEAMYALTKTTEYYMSALASYPAKTIGERLYSEVIAVIATAPEFVNR